MTLASLFDLANRYASVFLGLTLFSVVTVVIAMTLGVRVIAHLPVDYFVDPRRHNGGLRHYSGIVRIGIPIAKNMLGFILIIAGVIMLVLPGQGLLTLLAGLMLMNFPGKFACERWLVRRKRIRVAIAWLRQRSGSPPLILD